MSKEIIDKYIKAEEEFKEATKDLKELFSEVKNFGRVVINNKEWSKGERTIDFTNFDEKKTSIKLDTYVEKDGYALAHYFYHDGFAFSTYYSVIFDLEKKVNELT
jgi:hypothetical protein